MIHLNNSLTGSGKTKANLELAFKSVSKVIYALGSKDEIKDISKSIKYYGYAEEYGICTADEWKEARVIFTTMPYLWFDKDNIIFILEEKQTDHYEFKLRLTDIKNYDLSFFRAEFKEGNEDNLKLYLNQKNKEFLYRDHGLAVKLLSTGYYHINNLKISKSKDEEIWKFSLDFDYNKLALNNEVYVSSASIDHGAHKSIAKDTYHYCYSLYTLKADYDTEEYLNLVFNKCLELKLSKLLFIINSKFEIPNEFFMMFNVSTENTFTRGLNTYGDYDAVIDLSLRMKPNNIILQELQYNNAYRLSYEIYKNCQQNYARVARDNKPRYIFSFDFGTGFALKELNEARGNDGDYRVIGLISNLDWEVLFQNSHGKYFEDIEYYYDRILKIQDKAKLGAKLGGSNNNPNGVAQVYNFKHKDDTFTGTYEEAMAHYSKSKRTIQSYKI